MRKKTLVTLLGLTCITGVTHSMSCAYLNIILTNTSKTACKLVKQDLQRGSYALFTSAPTYLYPDASWQIVLQQSFYGPNLTLTYACGDGKEVTFSSQQDFCFLAAGDVNAQVLDAKNMTAIPSTTPGSWLLAQPGSINWSLE